MYVYGRLEWVLEVRGKSFSSCMLVSSLGTMSVTCNNNLVFGRTGLDFVSCGFSSNASINRLCARNCGKRPLANINRGCKARNLSCRMPDFGRCIVFSTKNPEAFLNAGASPVLVFRKETKVSASLSDIFEVVEENTQTLNRNLQSIVDSENPVLLSASKQILGAGGKRIRPALVFLVSRATAEIAGLKDLTEEHRRLAEIIELIHTASLIHDDVIDESEMRRGKDTVHQSYGTRVAVLAGDFMFAQALSYLANLETPQNLQNLKVVKLIIQAIKDFASGEIKQSSTLFDCDVQLHEYLIKSYNKTATLIAASTKGAAILSGVDDDISEHMYLYGKNLGLSFQVVDDILDFTQSAEQLGKPAGSDLAEGNLTAPVIFALEKETRLRDIIESKFRETGSLEEAIDIVKNCGGIDRARELARDLADEAVQNLRCLPPSSFRLALEQMANYNLERIK